ncbi:NAD-dependent epimerase/dehydratase family protein [Nocardia sp. NBC_00565]|uniref:NAD-dependent epimerase/dehydratase family protein n=1 Tax=Nocardia sp. NBC_00565 TaxID=2975993 RepID=UPI002E8225B3|nr:NAD-dependent epimerase/dehydratase family protein [Nocardia sp. NBC_00565]WUC07034.1 NAD-dependent epimerase/dehydratase family protein [Nocardia sp. NBC_00565]
MGRKGYDAMKALVTGASGFLGSHIVDTAVRAGDEVRAVVRPSSDLGYLSTVSELETVAGDLGDYESLVTACKGVDVVYHSAGHVAEVGSRAQFWEANVEGTRRLMKAAQQAGVGRFVFVSSPSVATSYDTDRFGVDESEPYVTDPKSLYVATKVAAEQLVLATNTPDFVTCALRPRMIWGPRSSGWMTLLLRKLKSGRLPDLSGGKNVMVSITYCEHAAQACLQAARSDQVAGNAYFLADSEDVDLWKFVNELAVALDLTPPTRTIPKPIFDAAIAVFDTIWRVPAIKERYPPPLSSWTTAALTVSNTYDTSAATRDFGYAPTVSPADGLAAYVEWVGQVGGVEAVLARG